MGESKNMMEKLSKMVGYFLVLLGLALFVEGIADIVYEAYNWSSSTSTVLYLIGDILLIVTAIVAWVISAKIMQAKSKSAA
jgi:hypothetical protein